MTYRRLLRAVPALLAMVLALTACSPAQQTGTEHMLWFANDLSDWEGPRYEAISPVPYTGELTVDALLDALLSGPPADSGLRSPFPSGARLLGWQLDEDGLLWVDLSESYGSLTGIALTVADYCLTLTLSQAEGVERVVITVSGRTISYRYRQELDPSQVVLSGVEDTPVEVSAVLYFPRSGGRGLGFESRTFQLTEEDVLVDVVARALLGGPEDSDLTRAIPDSVQLYSASLEDGVCVLNFSQALLDDMPDQADQQTLLIYSIVNTMGNLDSVDSVLFQVEGETLSAYGSVDLSAPLEPDFGLVGND